jgi:AcrR family transcriptional regulator|nr:TetR/AcrR family transcriptional regulator [Candidatus Krumholzibacteria bacterium]
MNQEIQLSRQEREWNSRHRAILKSATELYLEHGLSGTTMQMIADRSEFSVGYLYKHFADKRAMLNEIIDGVLEQYEKAREILLSESRGDPMGTIRKDLVQCAAQLQENAQVMPLFVSTRESSRSRIRQRILAYRHQGAALLQEAMDLGQIKPRNPDVLAAALDGVIFGLIETMIDTGQTHRFAELPAIVDELLLKPLETDPKGKDDTR